MALGISSIMVVVGLVRVILFGYTSRDALAIGTSLFLIVISSVVIGASLPILIQRFGFDPAHAGATIQVRAPCVPKDSRATLSFNLRVCSLVCR